MRATTTMSTLIRWVTIAVSSALVVTGVANPAFAERQPQKIVGGTEIAIDTVPWQVGLLYSKIDSSNSVFNGQFCGGSIVNETWVITAAHCLQGISRRHWLGVFAGNEDLDNADAADVFTVKRWIIHPDYETGPEADRAWFNDLALVQLESSLDFSDPDIEAIPLPVAVDGESYPAIGDVSESIYVSGWGSVIGSADDEPPAYPNVLYGVELDLLANGSGDFCGNYEAWEWNYRYEMCVGVTEGGKDTCWGDSGGPYVSSVDADGDGDREQTLVGVTSWGNGCAEAEYPGLAARVSPYVDWIIPRSPEPTDEPANSGTATRVSWTALSNQFLATPVTGYRIEYSLDAGDTWQLAGETGANARELVVDAVTGAEWRIAALNSVNDDDGPYLWNGATDTDTQRAGDVTDVPELFGMWKRTREYLFFDWSPPETVNGSAVWDYRIYRQQGSRAPRVVATSRSQYPSVRIDRTFKIANYWVVAVNNFGESEASNSISVR